MKLFVSKDCYYLKWIPTFQTVRECHFEDAVGGRSIYKSLLNNEIASLCTQ